ncbi:hypothetical protein M408DRAFT_231991 [Serendipita vermifera MAFF 305830]|uniref:Uncharacterized protein n=1 Tax=Serendipita vermifera MAFF 305830 TaxID=933852 RepID=A0A0C3AWV8_SERVB|nr:hypothetical protein M408DRAFT_231991 [Serendipita vermifera MAFF 305830]
MSSSSISPYIDTSFIRDQVMYWAFFHGSHLRELEPNSSTLFSIPLCRWAEDSKRPSIELQIQSSRSNFTIQLQSL